MENVKRFEKRLSRRYERKISESKQILEKCGTEYRRLKMFKSHKTFIQPISCKIDERLENRMRDGIASREFVPIFEQFISLRKV